MQRNGEFYGFHIYKDTDKGIIMVCCHITFSLNRCCKEGRDLEGVEDKFRLFEFLF